MAAQKTKNPMLVMVDDMHRVFYLIDGSNAPRNLSQHTASTGLQALSRLHGKGWTTATVCHGLCPSANV